MNVEGKIKITSGGNSVCLKQTYGPRYRYYSMASGMDEDLEKEYGGKTYKIRKKKKGKGYLIRKINKKKNQEIEQKVNLRVEKSEENEKVIFTIIHNDNEKKF